MRYRDKNLNIKFSNLAIFNLASAGVSIGDLLIANGADADKFCKGCQS